MNQNRGNTQKLEHPSNMWMVTLDWSLKTHIYIYYVCILYIYILYCHLNVYISAWSSVGKSSEDVEHRWKWNSPSSSHVTIVPFLTMSKGCFTGWNVQLLGGNNYLIFSSNTSSQVARRPNLFSGTGWKLAVLEKSLTLIWVSLKLVGKPPKLNSWPAFFHWNGNFGV